MHGRNVFEPPEPKVDYLYYVFGENYQKAPPGTDPGLLGPTRAKIKIYTFSELGFVHRRNVFEPPEPKVDYTYYVSGTLEILILVKGNETIAT